MNHFLEKYSPYIYAILRIVSGLMFAMHGSQKVIGIPGGKSPVPLASLLGVGGILELGCGLLIALGLVASYAAFIASGEMAVAYFMMHASHGFLPIVNQGELAVLYCFLFLYIAARGSGVWSIDSRFGRSRAMSAVLE
ncbi:DoxX family protein [Chroococcidiopsis sp. CCALA 051]|uniref:DoxX family protein n=1 Tax=Chroococcidiopsis sp. CCALA 051 TaxID=869949 RepID=UPI000D0CA1D7|nr:DoxX family protein [Chroococcidiopsis sp. CCALA 051]MBE9014572.1 DoxX family protein [Chroococcidiopsidales cyanobacterium LEGE 13417]PSM48936.1 DoxX family protein [Chroococcidiopsis sp. CCALA 051]